MTPELELLRPALLRLHGTLLQAERKERERNLGPISNQAWFGAALGDPALAWLRPALQLVSAIDEAQAVQRRTGETPAPEVVTGWLAAARAFVTPGPRYLELLQEDPDVQLRLLGEGPVLLVCLALAGKGLSEVVEGRRHGVSPEDALSLPTRDHGRACRPGGKPSAGGA